MTPTIETRFGFEGLLPVWAAVGVAAALIAVCWWMARRDSKVADRPRMVWALFALRTIAVLVLAWMLAGPTQITSLKEFRTRTVAVVVDRSASMGLVDVQDGSGNVARWAAARGALPGAEAGRALDQGVARLRVAQYQLERLRKAPPVGADLEQARALLREGAAGVERGAQEALQAARALSGATSALRGGIEEAAEELRQLATTDLKPRAEAFDRGKTLLAMERDAWLPDALARLSGATGVLEAVADQLAQSTDSDLPAGSNEAGAKELRLSRLDKVEQLLAQAEEGWLGALRKKATVTRIEFGDEVVPMGDARWEAPRSRPRGEQAAPLSPSTRLGQALQQVALEQASGKLAAAIVLTDGGQNAGRDPREVAGSLEGAAILIAPIGNTRLQRDVILHHTHAPKVALQNDQVVVDAMVTAYDCEGETLRVELLEGGALADSATVQVGSAVVDSRVQLRWKAAELGRHNLALRVTPVANERAEENNAENVSLLVMEDRIRVLVADNYPRWETRYLLNLLKRDDRVSFDYLLYKPELMVGDGALADFPATVEEWSKYQVVILGDVLPSQLTVERQRVLKEHIASAGGNLVIVAGREAMPEAYFDQPLGAILPVEAGERAIPGDKPFYLHVTDEGAMTLATQLTDSPGTSERIWREMSEKLPLHAFSEFSKPRPATHSLIWASPSRTSADASDPWTRSFLSWQFVGEGRVVYLAAPVTYQLRYRQGDRYHHRFWGQLLRWAVARELAEGSRTVRLTTDKSRYEAGENVQAQLRLTQLDGRAVSGAEPVVTAIQEGRAARTLALREDPTRPGTYHGTLEQLAVGAARIQVDGDRVRALLAAEDYRRSVETTIHVDPSGQLELRHPLCNLPLLREVADASGGLLTPPAGLETALEQLNLQPETLEQTTRMPLWNRWDLFWIFIACLGLEWAGRKWIGLS